MPIIRDFAIPKAASDLVFPPPATTVFFIAFLASVDPQTRRPWCPDVVAALPTLEASFTGAKKPVAAFVDVGSRLEWKDQKNVFRVGWNVNSVPALVRFEKSSEGGIREVGRLLEGEILDEERLGKLLS
ncbi:related to Thioredoxin domain-containing protein C21C3.12c [Ramularia collo-cygni]|uniref:Related to Thioredoxin domain-containing protein C21C3.12c n=1 Tax=Ramularia collo-cygni TaxID=112498 RepID=A0A2D3US13_9PEZI|nr:related to Thioredoxin domain-containing protein C21C3.12c [Ramularia collo-cygni]CZT17468.1 related to Thioredoxin domain-containing protein C21C3.12c [Ramularia collo-cygni]